ncbi:hypothetical protein E0W68_03625 [Flavobacterium salilacus subsp. salilacus]|uniref:DUF6929 family protein n=1 Tax=Flavobacterium TaxID=237 RepID=UPI0010756FFC|nr:MULTISPECIES: hypothetical protein [Flavobacterium]KAF2519449.1 hypothetical protein E0W68_03625 [Flavobacterium salilacus subsp. salilacus]MBE1614656.1 hypothetical protein [Flavobacterium sp. SaA2.13]
MQKFQLQLLFRIIGIGSASGLFFNGSSLFILSDNSHMLYEYHIDSKKLSKTALVAKDYNGPMENVPKKDKPDYEALAVKGNDLYLFGSGSTENRNSIGHIDMKTKEVFPHLDATDLYLAMQSFSEIRPENFNIEAAVNDGDTWYLLQRGNGTSGQNGIFTLEGNISDMFFQIIYNPIELPEIGGAQAGFTDAVKVGDRLYFLAAAEKSASTYLDGEVTGTIIGSIDIETMKLGDTQIIGKNKFEGITLYKDNGKKLEFLLCEDNDSPEAVSDIYKLTIDK